MKALFSDDIISSLEKSFKNKVDDKIEFKTKDSWQDIIVNYEKLINNSMFQNKEHPCGTESDNKYKYINFQEMWRDVMKEENFEKAVLVELPMEFKRFRHIYHSARMHSKIYLKREEEEFKTKTVTNNFHPDGEVIEKSSEEAAEDYDEYMRYIDANLDNIGYYDEVFLDDEVEETETNEDIIPEKRILGVKGDENHVFLPGKGKDIEKRVERLKEITVKSGSYLPIDVLNLIKIPLAGSEQQNPRSEYLAENVYTRLSAVVLEDDDVYSYFYISKLSSERDKSANGYRNKTVQDARKVYDKFCEFLSDGKQSSLDANIWAEELCGFSLGSKLFFALSGVFDVFSCNYRNMRIDCKGEKYSLDTDTQDFFLFLENIVENLIKVHSQYLRIVLVDKIAAECNKISSMVHARNKEHKEFVIEFLCEIALFLKDLVYEIDNINKGFTDRLRLMCYLVYKAKPNLSAEANSVEKEINLLVEKLENMIEWDCYWGISEEEWKHICNETADRKKGRVLYDKIARAIMRYNFEHNCEKTYIARRIKELFPDGIWAKMFKNSRGDVIARYYINEKIFGLIKIVKIEEEGKPDEILLSGSYFTNNMEQPGTISYNEFLRSDAILITDSENKDLI